MSSQSVAGRTRCPRYFRLAQAAHFPSNPTYRIHYRSNFLQWQSWYLVLLPFGFRCLNFISSGSSVLGFAKFPRFLSVPSFRLGIASRYYVRALMHKSGERLIFGPYSLKLENPFAPRSRYHPLQRAASIRSINFPFLRLPLDFW